jgi:site-specific DNA-methyltransferase (adenine-specific)
MTPYYERGGITIYHGDTLSVLAALDLGEVAAVVTDPPYSSGNLPESMKQKAPSRLRGWQWQDKIMETDQLSTLGFIWLMREVLVITRSWLPDGGSLLCFIDWRNWGNLVGAVESAGYRVNNMVVWDKKTIGMGNGFRNQHELVLYGSKGTPTVYARDVPNVLMSARPENTHHQSPKPVGMIARMLSVVAQPGGLIVDPFLGSGSTLVAARQLGMRAIGVEMEEKYCETAAKRLQQMPLDLGANEHDQRVLKMPLFDAAEVPA